ncbi:PQQ-binding-like beta-propeller repeat protein [Sphingobacterium sp. SGG-5]|uniref:outer membrane protein assembly factor BamB family protein n=1 Tax=Sphingobacterium sp. SGG-5 TaxID=2710881 RepID=UPI0013EBFA81|nr:PQQ-binding-like beta-propeller repeat protein [Sphingobacterium sp. SGG-5]NGM62408.1 PQQ-binding-like beta-propeller repeat protein [Sphingobacterium sp. SGG-5]
MKRLLVLPLVVFMMHAWGQKTTPEHLYDMGGKIDFFTLSESGVLLVAGGGGLAGIHPGAEKPHFVFTEYGKVKEEELEFVPASPYVIVNQGSLLTSKKTVIDLVTGKVLFATEDNGWRNIAQAKVFLPQNKLVVIGNRSKKEDYLLATGIYDLATGKQDGFASLDPKAGKVRMGNSVPQSSGEPFLSGDRVLVPTTKSMVCANFKNGEIVWTADLDKISWMSADKTGREIYGFEERPNGDTRIHKISNTGELLWKKERKIKGKISRFEILPQGLAIVSDVDNSGKSGIAKLVVGNSESKIAFLDAATGEDLWEKAPKTKGYVQHFYILEDGILFGIYSGGINKISFDGTTLFKKPLKTGENIHTMARTPQGVIYITDTDANIIDLSTGESVWNNPIKYKKARGVVSTYDKDHGRYLISTGDEVLAIDEKDGGVSTLAKIEFKEKEVPGQIVVRDGGILLAADQNLCMLDFEGKEKFHGYYKSPGQGGFLKATYGVLAVASMAMSSAAAYQGGRYGTYAGSNQLNSYGEQMKAYQEGFANIASVSFTAMNKRFKATSATENAQFILTALDAGIGLVKINKDTGKAEKEIVLKDKKPEYKVDDWGGYLYYKSGNGEVSAFKL